MTALGCEGGCAVGCRAGEPAGFELLHQAIGGEGNRGRGGLGGDHRHGDTPQVGGNPGRRLQPSQAVTELGSWYQVGARGQMNSEILNGRKATSSFGVVIKRLNLQGWCALAMPSHGRSMSAVQ